MSVLQQALKEVGLELTGDALPKQHRGVKAFQSLIREMRKAEAHVMDLLSKSERELNEAHQKIHELMERNRILESEARKARVKERMDEIAALTVADKAKLLEVSA